MLSEARNRKIEPAPTRASKGVEMEKKPEISCFNGMLLQLRGVDNLFV